MSNTKWVIDPVHSEVQFKVKHLMISTITGSFKNYESTVETDGDDLSTAKFNFTVDVPSITTNNEQRDGHLMSPDFFDAVSFPKITIEGSGMEKTGEDTYNVHTNMTIREKTMPVTLHVEYGGIMNDGWGNTRIGITVEGKLNRQDFGLTWNAMTETGGFVISNDVKLYANLQYIKQKEA